MKKDKSEETLTRSQKHYLKHREKILEQHKKYRDKRPAYSSEYYQKNKDRIRATSRATRIRNIGSAQGRWNAVNKRRRDGFEIEFSKEEFFDWVERTGKNCTYCNALVPQAGSGVDRIDPLIGYTLDNMTPCCTLCNQAKSTLSVEQFQEQTTRIYETFQRKASQSK